MSTETKDISMEEKAKELVERFLPFCECEVGYIYQQRENAKICALMCVDEIMKALAKEGWRDRTTWIIIEEYKQIKLFIGKT